jgi:hypothetical protein
MNDPTHTTQLLLDSSNWILAASINGKTGTGVLYLNPFSIISNSFSSTYYRK